ncbi:MAG: chitobiase/beta-hexosaminidase C-terminal domain-containing protein [Acidobacteria bacterium]|nr:chitobiase/beta-hexosaminidase C-terminal domain-containing protein [Acidobacteriota bacterium]
MPPLYTKPTPLAIDLVSRVNLESMRGRRLEPEGKQGSPGASQDEAVAELGSDNSIKVAGLAAKLSDGTYYYEARSLASGTSVRKSFEKHGGFVNLDLPSEGLFTVLIYDHLNTPRIDLLVAALRPPRLAKISGAFENVVDLLKEWNEDYQGWPVHDLRRFYLRSQMTGGTLPAKAGSPSLQAKKASTADVTCEPQFSPTPGVFKSDTEVTLLCGTPGAVIRYTVDGSQPLDGASVYQSPVIVKGTALTIKAFASAKGKKDSPVVTGIFRIGE